jgi:pimeloyl-ACP methyl ester carboxylesterase
MIMDRFDEVTLLQTTVSADGVPIRFDVRGKGDPALVFVHGWSCDRGYWRAQLDAFAERHQVVALDLAGHGESGAERADYTMPAFGEDVVAVVNQLGLGPMVLVGHSMGGDVIVEAALRLGTRVIGLVWVDVYRSLGRPPESLEEAAAAVAPFRTDFAASTRRFVESMFLPTSSPDLVRRVVDDMAAAPPHVALSAMGHAFTCEPSIVAALRRVKAPLVAINPDYRPSDVEALRRHGVRDVVVMPGVAHFLMMEDPGAFNRVLAETVAGFAA